MLYYDKIDVFEEIDINKTSASKERDICHKGLKFQWYVCNGCHDVLMMSLNLDNIAILNINDTDYCCIINGISKIDALNPLKYADLIEKRGV